MGFPGILFALDERSLGEMVDIQACRNATAEQDIASSERKFIDYGVENQRFLPTRVGDRDFEEGVEICLSAV